jgi:hypothetical protein
MCILSVILGGLGSALMATALHHDGNAWAFVFFAGLVTLVAALFMAECD